ncbi:Desulfo-A47934 sulfotransferase [bacterium HR40]|nr:Desulfo-A47934 sulfotransferase [bacterium HR40]
MTRKYLRRLLYLVLAPLSPPLALAFDRWLRGAREARKLRRADAVVVSYPKSGRTWLRAFLSFYYATARGLATAELLGFDNYHARDPSIPKILFTHDNYLVDALGEPALERLYAARPVILLVRDPRDVVVSAFHHLRWRSDPHKKRLHGLDAPQLQDLSGFLRDPRWGLSRILAFLSRWRQRLHRLPRVLLVRYEDLRRDTAGEFVRILRFLGEEPQPQAVARAVAEASFARLRERERSGAFAGGSRRLGAPVAHPDAFKVRAGEIGGWRRHFGPEDIAWITRTMAARMPEGFGYRPEEEGELALPVAAEGWGG